MRALIVFGWWVALACGAQNSLAGTIAGYTFTTLDDPYALSGTTVAHGINDAGQVTGYFTDATGDHGFIYDGSTWTTLGNNPFVSGGQTQGLALNDSGQLLGNVYEASSLGHQALYDGTTWTILGGDPGASNPASTFYSGINDAGVLSGFFDNRHAFIYDGTTYTTLNYPDPHGNGTFAWGLNDAGAVTGYFNGQIIMGGYVATHGFIYDGTTWTGFDAPDATGLNNDPLATEAFAINDTGLVAGIYRDKSSIAHGFVYDGTTFTEFDEPDGILGTILVSGINDSGTIVGRFGDAAGLHGFVATPVISVPEPPAWTMMIAGLGALACIRRRERPARSSFR